MSWREIDVPADYFKGRTFVAIEVNDDKDAIVFTEDSGTQYRMYHDRDCCETVDLYDVAGDLSDLIGTPIVEAEEVSNSDDKPSDYAESWTWTFYKFGTIKGHVTLRWLGESNGYYSESVVISIIGSDRYATEASHG